MRGGIGTPEPGANDPTRGGGWFTDRYNASWHVAERVILPGRAFTRMCMCIHTRLDYLCGGFGGKLSQPPAMQPSIFKNRLFSERFRQYLKSTSEPQNITFFDLRRGKKPGLP